MNLKLSKSAAIAFLIGVTGSTHAFAFGVQDIPAEQATPRSDTIGVGAVASENESARTALGTPANGVGVKPLVGVDATMGPAHARLHLDDAPGFSSKSDSHAQVYRAYGLLPLGRIAGSSSRSGLALSASRSSTESESDDTDDGKYRESYTQLALTGSLGVGPMTFGLSFRNVAFESKDDSTYTSDVSSDVSRHRTSNSDTSYDNVSLGVAWRPTSLMRIGATYTPKVVKWYKEKSKTEETNKVTGIVSTDSDTWTDGISESETIRLGASFRAPNSQMRFIAGVARFVPFHEEKEEKSADGTSTSTSEEGSDGATVISLGTELQTFNRVTPRFGVSNTDIDHGYFRRVAAGMDLGIAEAAVLTFGANYDFARVEDDGYTFDLTSYSGTIGVSANL